MFLEHKMQVPVKLSITMQDLRSNYSLAIYEEASDDAEAVGVLRAPAAALASDVNLAGSLTLWTRAPVVIVQLKGPEFPVTKVNFIDFEFVKV